MNILCRRDELCDVNARQTVERAYDLVAVEFHQRVAVNTQERQTNKHMQTRDGRRTLTLRIDSALIDSAVVRPQLHGVVVMERARQQQCQPIRDEVRLRLNGFDVENVMAEFWLRLPPQRDERVDAFVDIALFCCAEFVSLSDSIERGVYESVVV